MQPLEGCAAYIIQQEGLGVEVLTTNTIRPSNILENPLPCQKRKGVISVEVWSSFPNSPPTELTVYWGGTIHGIVFKGELTYKMKKTICWNYIHSYANSKYGM